MIYQLALLVAGVSLAYCVYVFVGGLKDKGDSE